MKRKILLTLGLMMSLAAFSQHYKITLEDLTSGKYYARRIYGVMPMQDGETYTQLSDDRTQIVRRSFVNGGEAGVLFDARTAKGPFPLKWIEGYEMSPDESHILLQTETSYIYRRSYLAQHYIYDVKEGTFIPLSDNGRQQVPVFSPDGKSIAFARGNNLFIARLNGNKAPEEIQVTTDGLFNHVLNGTPDWVNEEEFSTNCSFCWTEDSKSLCWVRYDESQVPIYSMQMYKGQRPEIKDNDEYPGSYDYKYPVAGAKNSDVCVKSFDLETGATRTLDVPLDADGYIPCIRTTSEAGHVAVVTLNRHQDCMKLYSVSAASGEAKLILEEKDGKYLRESAYTALTFYPGCFVMTSGRSGYDQLYLYDLSGKLLRRLSADDCDVTNFYGYDPKTEKAYYQAADMTPMQRSVIVCDKKGNAQRLTEAEGTNDAIFSKNFQYFMHVHSSLTVPYRTTLCNARGKKMRTLEDNAQLKERTDKVCGKKSFFSFTTSEGVTLNGWMVQPRDFDATKRYPVIMYQYGGPGSQEVLDSWRMGQTGGGLFESYMAERGYIFVCVDGRGTGARGAEFEKCTYLNLGVLEARDQVETALYLGTLPYVDKERIGIWGWSFGGFNTLMSMSEGRPVFKAGVAVAAPTNWKYYDTVYTERYMRTPQENPGYSENPISRAEKLHGNLLLVHGTADDNVHFRNCTEYTEALVQTGKQFDMQVYTNRNHFIMGGNTRNHLYHRITEFFQKNL
ncbi:MAG: DPP IV N-terminal domain-containing protein [Alloprevotella sp.]|nr:DPP IV N-terminal domain-containing protein [Alloprevotella sp.]